MKTLISNIKQLELKLYKSNPPIYSLRACGQVPTSSWSEGLLVPYIYIQPPADGIQEFIFIAKPPARGSIILPYFANITAEIEYPTGIGWLKGFRVSATDNSMEILLDEATSNQFENIVDDSTIPWPLSAY